MILQLDIITPEKTLFSSTVMLVTVPSVSGSFTIMQGHAPIIAILDKGEIRCIGQDGVEHNFPCLSGVAECKENKVVVLIETK